MKIFHVSATFIGKVVKEEPAVTEKQAASTDNQEISSPASYVVHIFMYSVSVHKIL